MGSVTVGEHFLLSELGIVVEVDLGVAHDHPTVRSLREGVDFHQGTVMGPEHLVQFLDHHFALLVRRGVGDEPE